MSNAHFPSPWNIEINEVSVEMNKKKTSVFLWKIQRDMRFFVVCSWPTFFFQSASSLTAFQSAHYCTNFTFFSHSQWDSFFFNNGNIFFAVFAACSSRTMTTNIWVSNENALSSHISHNRYQRHLLKVSSFHSFILEWYLSANLYRVRLAIWVKCIRNWYLVGWL